MNKKTVEISKREYDILTKIAFLESDNILADKDEDFRVDMHVNIESNKKEIAKLVDIWESLA